MGVPDPINAYDYTTLYNQARVNDGLPRLYTPEELNASNPLATILSAAMLLRYSFDLDHEADAIESAVQSVLTEGYRTGDIMSEGCSQVGTAAMGDLIAARIR